MSDDWSDFSALDDDEIIGTNLDKTEYAVEDDSQEAKAAVGASLEAPEIERDAEPIEVPAGTWYWKGSINGVSLLKQTFSHIVLSRLLSVTCHDIMVQAHSWN